MPFHLFSRSRPPTAEPEIRSDPPGVPGARFEAITEVSRITGRVRSDVRLLDLLNRRVPFAVDMAAASPLDDPGEPRPDASLAELDPYELVAVLVGPDSVPDLDPARRAAVRIRRIPYGVRLDVGVVAVAGTVHMHPGTDPRRLRDLRSELFFPVTDAVVRRGERVLGGPWMEAALVSRAYLRDVESAEAPTGDGSGAPGATEAGRRDADGGVLPRAGA